MQEHPKTGGVCAQMQPKRSKNNLQIFMQIFEYLTGHMMFKVGMKSFQLNQFWRQRQRSMWSGMFVALLDVFHFSVRAPSTRTRALTKMFLLLSICTRQWQRGKGTQERMICSISHQRTWMPCLWSRRGPLAVYDDHPGGFIWIFHLICWNLSEAGGFGIALFPTCSRSVLKNFPSSWNSGVAGLCQVKWRINISQNNTIQ